MLKKVTASRVSDGCTECGAYSRCWDGNQHLMQSALGTGVSTLNKTSICLAVFAGFRHVTDTQCYEIVNCNRPHLMLSLQPDTVLKFVKKFIEWVWPTLGYL